MILSYRSCFSEIWFTGSREGSPRSVWSVTRAGKLRSVAQAPGALTLRDISPDGRVLVSRDIRRLEMAGLVAGDSEERGFSWMDWSRVSDVTPDHRLILFDESGEAAGQHSLAYIQNTADKSAIRLGEGVAMALSPDGRFALMASEDRLHLRLVPVTGGAPRELPDAGLSYQWAKFLPDGGRLVVLANEPQKGLRLYVRPLDGPPAVPISPETMVRNAAISPDGRQVAVLSSDDGLVLYPTGGGVPRVIPTSEPLAPLRWSPNGESILVQHLRGYTELPARISRIGIPSGRLVPWREIMPSDRGGITSV